MNAKPTLSQPRDSLLALFNFLALGKKVACDKVPIAAIFKSGE